MGIETQAYETDALIAGQVKTRDDAQLAADTYYKGMPLAYVPTVTAGGTNTGTGTVAVIGGKKQQYDIIVEFTAALVFKLTVNSVDVLTGIALTDGGTTIIGYNGLQVAVTDGGTAFVSGDDFTISFSGGAYAYNLTDIQAIYNGVDARVLSSAGRGTIIFAGDILKGGLVDGAGAALTITDQMILNAQDNGIYIRDRKSA